MLYSTAGEFLSVDTYDLAPRDQQCLCQFAQTPSSTPPYSPLLGTELRFRTWVWIYRTCSSVPISLDIIISSFMCCCRGHCKCSITYEQVKKLQWYMCLGEQLELALDLGTSCFCLPSVEVTGMQHYGSANLSKYCYNGHEECRRHTDIVLLSLL